MVSNELSWYLILTSALLVNNIVLLRFLALCSFFGVSNKVETSIGMGIAVMFVMVMACSMSWAIYNYILIPFDLIFLRTAGFILSIASLVQLEELYIRKMLPKLYKQMGIFLPLITTNCAILGLALFQTNRQYNFVQSLSFAVGAGAGFTLALLLMSGIRERLELSEVASVVKGAALTLMVAGVLSMAFMGFAGMGR